MGRLLTTTTVRWIILAVGSCYDEMCEMDTCICAQRPDGTTGMWPEANVTEHVYKADVGNRSLRNSVRFIRLAISEFSRALSCGVAHLFWLLKTYSLGVIRITAEKNICLYMYIFF